MCALPGTFKKVQGLTPCIELIHRKNGYPSTYCDRCHCHPSSCSQPVEALARHHLAVHRAEGTGTLLLTAGEHEGDADSDISEALQAMREVQPCLLGRLTAMHVVASRSFTGAVLHRGQGMVPLLASLKELRLFDCPAVDDRAAHALTGLTQLQLLHLDGCAAVTDWGLQNVGSLRALSGLWLTGCSISDVTMQRVAGMRNLRHLCVKHCLKVTEAGLDCVRRLPNLSILLKPDGQYESKD